MASEAEAMSAPLGDGSQAAVATPGAAADAAPGVGDGEVAAAPPRNAPPTAAADASGDDASAPDSRPEQGSAAADTGRAAPTPSSSTEEQPAGAPPPSRPPPPGYLLVTVHMEDGRRLVEDLPVEVLYNHTFAHVCEAALARVPDAPHEYSMQAYLVAGQLELPVQDPHTPARPTLRSFPGVRSLRYDIAPLAAGEEPRTVRTAARLTRQQAARQRWARRVARLAVLAAKVVLTVEAAALLRRGVPSTVRQLRRAAGWSGTDAASLSSEDGGAASRLEPGLESAMGAVADFVAGRGGVEALMGHPPEDVVRALRAVDTEVLQELDVADVPTARAAIGELLQELQDAQQKQKHHPQQQRQEREREPGQGTSAEEEEDASGRDGRSRRGPGQAEGAPTAGGAGSGPGSPGAAPLPGFGPGTRLPPPASGRS